ncbi:MAG TPA: hypothetical protein VGH29_19665, partial [Candidatus Binataceae bacterium]
SIPHLLTSPPQNTRRKRRRIRFSNRFGNLIVIISPRTPAGLRYWTKVQYAPVRLIAILAVVTDWATLYVAPAQPAPRPVKEKTGMNRILNRLRRCANAKYGSSRTTTS